MVKPTSKTSIIKVSFLPFGFLVKSRVHCDSSECFRIAPRAHLPGSVLFFFPRAGAALRDHHIKQRQNEQYSKRLREQCKHDGTLPSRIETKKRDQRDGTRRSFRDYPLNLLCVPRTFGLRCDLPRFVQPPPFAVATRLEKPHGAVFLSHVHRYSIKTIVLASVLSPTASRHPAATGVFRHLPIKHIPRPAPRRPLPDRSSYAQCCTPQ